MQNNNPLSIVIPAQAGIQCIARKSLDARIKVEMIKGMYFFNNETHSMFPYFLCLGSLDSRRSLPSTTIGGGNDT